MYKKNALSEAEKLRIAELCRTTDLSPSSIADALGVSARTIRRYKNYLGEEEAIDSIDETEKASYSISVGQWECKRCGFETDRRLKYCRNCGSGPFDAIFLKIGSPKHESYIRQKVSEEQETEEEIVDPTRDYWICQKCDYISNIEFDICPECGYEGVVFAPDGIEPKTDQEEDNNEPLDNEEESEEFDWICPSCGHEFNGSLSRCPKCGKELDTENEYDYECSECGYEFNRELKKCPGCGEKFH